MYVCVSACVYTCVDVCVCDILINLALYLQTNEKECDIFNMLSLSICDHGVSLL